MRPAVPPEFGRFASSRKSRYPSQPNSPSFHLRDRGLSISDLISLTYRLLSPGTSVRFGRQDRLGSGAVVSPANEVLCVTRGVWREYAHSTSRYKLPWTHEQEDPTRAVPLWEATLKVVVRPCVNMDLEGLDRLRTLVYPHLPQAFDTDWNSSVWRWLGTHPLADEMHRWVRRFLRRAI